MIEEDPGAVPIIKLPPTLEKVEIFKPLKMGGTTPSVVMMILGITIGGLIPVALFLDKLGEISAKKESFLEPS